MDLPQQVLNAAIVELIAPVTVLIQPAYLAHEEVRDLKKHANQHRIYNEHGDMNMYLVCLEFSAGKPK